MGGTPDDATDGTRDEATRALLVALLDATTVVEVRRIVLASVPDAAGCDCAALVEPAGGAHLDVYADAADPETPFGTLALDTTTAAGRAIISGEPVPATGNDRHPALEHCSTTLAIPLSADGGTVGAVVFGWQRDGAVDVDSAGCSRIAGWIASALARTRLAHREATLAAALRGEVTTTKVAASGLEIHGRYLPPWSGIPLGGDWHDAWEDDRGCAMIVLGDVAGHGVDVSPAMLTLRSYVRASTVPADGLAPALSRLDRTLEAFDDDHGLAALLLASYDPVQRTFSWLNAGLPDPMLHRADGAVEHLTEGRTRLVGTGLDRPPPVVASVVLDVGDTVICYTDGLLLPMLEESVDTSSVAAAIARMGDAALSTVADELLALSPSGALRIDDASVLLVRVSGTPAAVD